MSALKRKNSAKKRTTKKRRSVRARKPKIKLNQNSVFALTGVIALACVLLLVISIYINSPHAARPAVSAQKEEAVHQNTSAVEPAPANDVAPAKETAAAKPAPANDVAPAKETATTKPAPANDVVPAKETVAVKPAPANEVASAKETAVAKPAPAKNTNSAKTNTATTKPSAPAKSVVPPDHNQSEQSVSQGGSSHQTPSTPVVPYQIPAAVNGATLVFIFDDAGQSVARLKRYTTLPFPVTIAVLPQLAHSKDCADAIRASGKEVMLHQPMQAENLKVNPGPGAITPQMSTFDIAETLKRNIAEVGPIKGLNNHEGSLITEDVIKIGAVLDVAAEDGIYFVDSRTTAATKAPQAALERDMSIFERDVFLDDVVNKDEILKQIYRALGIANKKGKAIIIGHVDKSADIIPALLRDMYPYLKMKGYTFSTPSKLR